jgi:hypothetical protein
MKGSAVRACLECGVLVAGGPTRCTPWSMVKNKSWFKRLLFKLKLRR